MWGKKAESRGYFGNSPTEKSLQTIVLLGSSPQKFLFFFGSSLESLFHVCCKRSLNSRIKKNKKIKTAICSCSSSLGHVLATKVPPSFLNLCLSNSLWLRSWFKSGSAPHSSSQLFQSQTVHGSGTHSDRQAEPPPGWWAVRNKASDAAPSRHTQSLVYNHHFSSGSQLRHTAPQRTRLTPHTHTEVKEKTLQLDSCSLSGLVQADSYVSACKCVYKDCVCVWWGMDVLLECLQAERESKKENGKGRDQVKVIDELAQLCFPSPPPSPPPLPPPLFVCFSPMRNP